MFRNEKDVETVILIDIGATEITGAYVRYEEGTLPTVYYTRRLPIETRSHEAHTHAMLRALSVLGDDLIRQGAPILARALGTGSANQILVSIGAPWQETTVRTIDFEEAEPFVFTKGLVSEKLKESINTPVSTKKMLVDNSIIGTVLNGYETHKPYGRKVHRARIIVLTSLIEEKVAQDITTMLRGLYHTKNILPITDSSLRYQAMREAFPHEQDAIIIDATSASLTSISLVRKNAFVTMVHVTTPTDDTMWIARVTEELAEIAKRYPLPRTIFLLAREPGIFSLRKELDKEDLRKLWLSDEPPKIVSVLKSSLIRSIRHMTTHAPDLVLLLMTRYFQDRRRRGGQVM